MTTVSWLLGIFIFSLSTSATSTELSSENPVNQSEERLLDFQGNPRSLADYTGGGKWLVVMIWASDCHICNREVKEYIEFHNEYQKKNASVLGISIDGWEKKQDAVKFIERHGVTFPNLIGSAETVTAAYRRLTGEYLAGTPTFMVYDPSGALVAKQAGAVPVTLIEEFITKNPA